VQWVVFRIELYGDFTSCCGLKKGLGWTTGDVCKGVKFLQGNLFVQSSACATKEWMCWTLAYLENNFAQFSGYLALLF
jgi:hypothetical protein